MKIFRLLALLTLFCISGCGTIHRVMVKSINTCPINDRSYFYKQQGLKAPRTFKKNRI